MIQKMSNIFPKLQPKFKYVLIAIIILFMVLTMFSLVHAPESVSSTQNAKNDLIARKVILIMQMYHCESPQIFNAIMDTFDPVLVATVIALESEFRPNAVSPAGARGLMQLTPDKLDDWRDVTKNIKVGSLYLKEQMDRFGNFDLAIAAYNAGPHSVAKYRGVPPFKETIQYVKKAKLFSSTLDKILSQKTTAISSKPEA